MSILAIFQFISDHPLTRDARVSAIWRFLRWQILSRFRRGDHIYPWISGTRFLVRANETGLTGNIYVGLHEFADMAFLLHFLRPEDLFVDVGANVGSYTLLASSVVGARGIAIEPVPSTYERLVANCNLNPLGERVQAFNVALGERRGAIYLTSNEDTMNHVLAPNEEVAQAIRVETLPLDDLLEHDAPSLIKIDVEGYEIAVLAGARRVLSQPSLHAVIVEINAEGNRYGYDSDVLFGTMESYGFAPYSYEPFQRKLTPQPSREPSSSGNMLFIRNVEWAKERVRSAPRVMILGKRF